MAKAIDRHLETLCQADPKLRRQALEHVLAEERLTFTTQEEEASAKNPRGICNYLVSSCPGDPSLLFCAHYDAVPGSPGANDNGAALCILIQLAVTLKEEGIPAKFAFFDGEEMGNSGSRLYVSLADRQTLSGVINLDVCGYGDSLVICGKGHEKKPVFRSFCQKSLLGRHQGHIVKFLPKSDDSSFSRMKLPTLSLAAMPRWDIQYLNALASYGEGLFGRPPEFELILGQMEVTSTMHGGYRDTLEWIERGTMENVYAFLLEGIRQQKSKEAGSCKKFHALPAWRKSNPPLQATKHQTCSAAGGRW